MGIFASAVQCLGRHGTPPPKHNCVWGLGVWFVLFCFVGGFSGGVTPGPFPNPEAKPVCADGTAPGRVWESRSPPAFIIVCVKCVGPYGPGEM